MNRFFKLRWPLLLAALAPIILALAPADVAAQTQNAPSPRRTQNEAQKDQMNAWTVGLAGGLLEGAPSVSLPRWLAQSTMGRTCMCCLSSPAALSAGLGRVFAAGSFDLSESALDGRSAAKFAD
jgi:hypothetical protein